MVCVSSSVAKGSVILANAVVNIDGSIGKVSIVGHARIIGGAHSSRVSFYR